MQKNKSHSEIGEKRFLWRQIIQQPDISNEIFQRTSLRIISRRKKETENISEKIEAKKKELLQNQAEHEELLAELSKQNCDTQKIATLVSREMKNEFLENAADKDLENFHDKNIIRGVIENLWKILEKNFDVAQCEDLAEKVSQILQAMQHDGVNVSGTDFNAALKEIMQIFSEEARSARSQKAMEDWEQQKKELENIFSAQGFENRKLGEKSTQDIENEKKELAEKNALDAENERSGKIEDESLRENTQSAESIELAKKNSLASFLESLEKLSPEDRWKIADKILKAKNISPDNLENLTDHIASADRAFAQKIDPESLLGTRREEAVDESKKSWRSTIANFFKKKFIWLLLLFLVMVVCFFIMMNEKNYEITTGISFSTNKILAKNDSCS